MLRLSSTFKRIMSLKRKKRVLAIDDEPAMTEWLKILLEHAGFDVRTALIGARGEELFRTWRPDAVVTDMILPDVDGIGSLLETWLPWVGVPVLVLLLAAAIVHTRRAVAAALVAVLVWTALYGPTMLPRGTVGCAAK